MPSTATGPPKRPHDRRRGLYGIRDPFHNSYAGYPPCMDERRVRRGRCGGGASDPPARSAVPKSRASALHAALKPPFRRPLTRHGPQ